MLAMNYDPSRDILQQMLNPYEGLEDTERVPNPFQVKKTSKFSMLNKRHSRRVAELEAEDH